MRPFVFVALIAGAAGSIGLMLHAKQHPPFLLLVFFIVWVVSPFAAFGMALLRSKRWTTPMQAALHLVIFAVALLSLLIYGDDAVHHRAAHPAFVYVAVPPASWLLGATVLSITAFKTKSA